MSRGGVAGNENNLVMRNHFGLKCEHNPTLNAYLGVSLTSISYFKKSTMREYIRWILARYGKLIIVVADHLEAYNKHASGWDMSEAEEHTQRTGLEFKESRMRAIPPELANMVDIRLISNLLQREECRQLVGFVGVTAEKSNEFREAIRKTSETAFQRKLLHFSLGSREREQKLDILQNYMIEEIGIILYLTCCCEPLYHVSVFNYAPPDLLFEVFDGRFSEHFEHLTGRHPYRAIELVQPKKL